MKCPRCKLYHSWAWTRDGRLGDPPFEEECNDDEGGGHFELVDHDLFHIDGVKMFRCVSCGSTTFTAGQAAYQTVLKCVRCGWEATVHDG
ncbi:hypothetical protein LCGC14_0259090 [marine sediment metagenome]|uniref:Uncharacterized protein n=1 Tax=marine sediment metagenome TaxID=412755 RepID=A0A0F9U775_9ZZZZ